MLDTQIGFSHALAKIVTSRYSLISNSSANPAARDLLFPKNSREVLRLVLIRWICVFMLEKEH